MNSFLQAYSAIPTMKTNENRSIEKMSFDQPVLLIFLRNFGCAFCRQSLSDLSKQRAELESRGISLVLVHLNENEVARKYLERYDLVDLERVEDKHMRYYADFGLVKGDFNQLFGLQNWIRGFKSSVLKGHGMRMPLDDVFQMPGIFLIKDGKIENQFIHKMASDRPDYIKLTKVKSSPKKALK